MLMFIWLIPLNLFSYEGTGSFNIGLENLTASANNYQINGEGDTEMFDWHIGIKTEYKFLFLNTKSVLGLGFFFPKTSDDQLYQVYPITLNLQMNLGRFIGFNWFGGIGLYNLVIQGANETITLQNGDSTSTFYGPKTTKYNLFFVPELGIKQNISQSLFLKYTLSSQDILQDKRSFNYFISIMWRL